MDLKNRVIVITGGSQGFGKALAKFLLAEGGNVVVSSESAEAVRKAEKELSCDGFCADVTVPEDVRKLGAYAFRKYGKIDVWINNAGIQIVPSFLEEIDVQRMRQLFDVNFFGYFYGCRTALAYMKTVREGVIVNINSTAGLGGKPMIAAYASSKFAVRGLTESLREELKGSGVAVYGVFPGGMKTEIYKDKYPSDFEEYMEVDAVAKKVVDNLKADDPQVDLVIKRPVKSG